MAPSSEIMARKDPYQKMDLQKDDGSSSGSSHEMKEIKDLKMLESILEAKRKLKRHKSKSYTLLDHSEPVEEEANPVAVTGKKDRRPDASKELITACIVKDKKSTLPGIALTRKKRTVCIAKVLEGGLVAKSDLRVGDEIVRINDVDCRGKLSKEVGKILTEATGAVTVLVKRSASRREDPQKSNIPSTDTSSSKSESVESPNEARRHQPKRVRFADQTDTGSMSTTPSNRSLTRGTKDKGRPRRVRTPKKKVEPKLKNALSEKKAAGTRKPRRGKNYPKDKKSKIYRKEQNNPPVTKSPQTKKNKKSYRLLISVQTNEKPVTRETLVTREASTQQEKERKRDKPVPRSREFDALNDLFMIGYCVDDPSSDLEEEENDLLA